MPARPDATILFLGRTAAARAEISGGHCSSLQRPPSPSTGSLAQRVHGAAAGAPLRGPVWILTDEVYSQSLTLPTAAAGMRAEETTAALALEAQLVSGIPAAEGSIGWRHLPGDGREREYWIAQLRRDEMEELRSAVRRQGGRLEGVLHPAGVPRKLLEDAAPPGRWRRVEYWPDLGAAVEDAGEAGLVARLRRGAPPRGRIESPASECLLGTPGAAALAQPALRTLRLDDDAVLGRWLEAWAEVLRSEPHQVPVVRPEERPMGGVARAALLAGSLAAVLLAGGLHYHLLASQRDRDRAHAAALRVPIERLKKAEANVRLLEKKAGEFRASAGRRPSGPVPGLSGRILETLAAGCPDGVMLDGFSIGWDRSSVRGYCADPGLAERLAGVLGRDLASEQRRVAAASKKLRTEGPAAGFYEFEILVHPPPPAPTGRTP